MSDLLGEAATEYMRANGMPDYATDQQQNWILGHLVTFAHRARALPSTPPLDREAVLAEGRRLGLEEAAKRVEAHAAFAHGFADAALAERRAKMRSKARELEDIAAEIRALAASPRGGAGPVACRCAFKDCFACLDRLCLCPLHTSTHVLPAAEAATPSPPPATAPDEEAADLAHDLALPECTATEHVGSCRHAGKVASAPPPATGGTDRLLDLCRHCGHERAAHDAVNGCCADECESCDGCPGFEMSAGPATGERGGRTAAEERADVVAWLRGTFIGLPHPKYELSVAIGNGAHIGAATAPGGGTR